MRRGEDAFVDTLLEPAVAAHNFPLISARWGRAFIDLNRGPDEIDAVLLSDPQTIDHLTTTERTRSGLGVVPRITGPGLDIYKQKQPYALLRQRIDAIHGPYHQRLGKLLQAAHDAHGFAVLVDCHSMPSLPFAPRTRPQFVIGDAHGCSAPDHIPRWIESALRRQGYRCIRNTPYAGGYTTRHHAVPANRIFAVQIEIDRALYMDPETLVPHDGFSQIANTLESLTGGLLRHLRETLARPSTSAIAAE